MLSNPTQRWRARASAFLLYAASTTGAAIAQCGPQVLAGEGLPGTNFYVSASTMWDPDGAGPALPLLVLGGSFTVAGNVPCNFVAAQEPITGNWSTFGTGTNGPIQALLPCANGDLIAGGWFNTIDGVNAVSVARFDGTSWHPMGMGLAFSPRDLLELPNGDLVAAGYAPSSSSGSGFNAEGLARWTMGQARGSRRPARQTL